MSAAASLVVVVDAWSEAFHSASVAVMLLGLLLMHSVRFARIVLTREAVIYGSFVAYMLIQLLWTGDRVMAVNVKSMYLTCRHALPVMVKQRSGAIVNNSSLTSIRFTYPCLPYSVSKSAVNELTRSVAMQYAQHGIRANAVVPGLMATPRITKRLQDTYGDAYRDQLKERDDLIPLGRMGDAWDVAHAVLFLASDEAKYVTGIELVVDGGLSASVLGRPWRD